MLTFHVQPPPLGYLQAAKRWSNQPAMVHITRRLLGSRSVAYCNYGLSTGKSLPWVHADRPPGPWCALCLGRYLREEGSYAQVPVT